MTRFIAINWRSYDTWRMRFALTFLLLAGLALLPARSDAFDIEQTLKAQHVQYQGEQIYSVAQQGGMTLSQAIESVRRRTNGRVVSAQTRVQGGREVHYIKVLTKDGKVKTHKVNGRSR
ncbi:MAG: hypothetical protein KJO95_00110 [Gammaproteobacteria bacterium]|nr:hypothetical protein [Gammaproteobacteria bacterium]MBU2675762.1 hypothetical protein [Gammaproteobacteria bacterium]NNL49500.1 hypothetical protein [Woeseiaceae bacterium]